MIKGALITLVAYRVTERGGGLDERGAERERERERGGGPPGENDLPLHNIYARCNAGNISAALDDDNVFMATTTERQICNDSIMMMASIVGAGGGDEEMRKKRRHIRDDANMVMYHSGL